jgi:hypothetical protein
MKALIPAAAQPDIGVKQSLGEQGRDEVRGAADSDQVRYIACDQFGAIGRVETEKIVGDLTARTTVAGGS